MILLHIVGDGPRDEATLPRLVERILGLSEQLIASTFSNWARLHGEAGRGFGRKLSFAVRQAIDAGASGLVAVVDRDRDHQKTKLDEMFRARDEDRSRGRIIPAALGEAVPHGEAWLLDDAVAVRAALGLSPKTSIPSIARTKNPKGVLTMLLGKSPRHDDRPVIVWGEIARTLVAARCKYASRTGFAAFINEVEAELRNVLSGRR